LEYVSLIPEVKIYEHDVHCITTICFLFIYKCFICY